MNQTRSARTLVIVRLGADHRVSGWAKAPKAERGWDLLLSPYEEVPDLAEFEADLVAPAEGGKWDAVHRLFAERPELLAYDRFWIPDDDIEADAATVARFLALAEARDLALCQPALTRGSHFSHFVTVENRFTELRFTNFVELMAPLLAREVLAAALPHMAGRGGAKGLDFVWHRFVDGDAARRIAVIDAAPMGHHRPLGRHLAARMAAAGDDIEAERRAFFGENVAGYYRALAHGHPGGGRLSVTLLSLATLVSDPRLWRAGSAERIAKFFWAQLFCSTWQGTR